VINTLVVIMDTQTYISLQVINSSTKTLLLEMNKYKADIFSNIKKLRFKYQRRTIEINVINTRDQMVLESIREGNINML